MANRNNRPMGNRRMDFNRMDRNNGLLPRPMPQVSPWQQGGPAMPLNNMLPLGNTSEATLVLANNLINNLLQGRTSSVPSLLDVPVQRNFPNQDFNRGVNRMGNQPNFRRGPGNYISPANRNNKNFRPLDGNKRQPNNQRRDDSKFKNKQSNTQQKKTSTPSKKESDATESIKKEDGGNDVSMESAEAPPAEGQAGAGSAAKEGEVKTPEKKVGKTAYDDIAAALLHCHVCKKVMWDGRSFENHINGRAHHMMMDKTAESYALTADTIRQELKIHEMKNNRRQGKVLARKFYCPMCDLYASDGSSHRTSLGHRKLKKFLHPTCGVCNKEMPTRIDLDEHKLSVEHMATLQSKKGPNIKIKPQNMTISTLVDEENYVRTDRRARKTGKNVTEAAKEGSDAAKEGGEAGADQAEGETQPEGVEVEEDVLIDWKEGQDVAELADKKTPRYSPTRGVGASFVVEQKVYECHLCHKYLDTEETVQVHLRTWRHHTLFVKHLDKLLKGKDSEDAKKRANEIPDEIEAKRPKMEEDGEANGQHDEEAGATVKSTGADESLENGDEEMLAADGDEGEEEEEGQGGEDIAEWERDIDELINDIPDTEEQSSEKSVVEEKPVKEEKPVVEEKTVVQTPSKRGRGRGRGRGARR